MNTLLGKAELSYWISNDYQGRGIMILVCRKMIHYAFYFLCFVFLSHWGDKKFFFLQALEPNHEIDG